LRLESKENYETDNDGKLLSAGSRIWGGDDLEEGEREARKRGVTRDFFVIENEGGGLL